MSFNHAEAGVIEAIEAEVASTEKVTRLSITLFSCTSHIDMCFGLQVNEQSVRRRKWQW